MVSWMRKGEVDVFGFGVWVKGWIFLILVYSLWLLFLLFNEKVDEFCFFVVKCLFDLFVGFLRLNNLKLLL